MKKHVNFFFHIYKCGLCHWPKCEPITKKGISTCEHCFAMYVLIF